MPCLRIRQSVASTMAIPTRHVFGTAQTMILVINAKRFELHFSKLPAPNSPGLNPK